MLYKIREIVLAATGLVKDNFGIRAEIPSETSICENDDLFADLVGKEPTGLKKWIGEFHRGNVDWRTVREQLIKQIKKTFSQNRSSSPAHT